MLVSQAVKYVEFSRSAPASTVRAETESGNCECAQTLPKGCNTSLLFCQGLAMLQMESSDEKALINLRLFKAELPLSVQELRDAAPLHLLGGKMVCGEAMGLFSAPGMACSARQTAGSRLDLRNLPVAPWLVLCISSVFFCHSVVSCISEIE